MVPVMTMTSVCVCVCVFFKVLARCLPVNLYMYLLTVYNLIDDVVLCCDQDPDPPKSLESCFLLYVT